MALQLLSITIHYLRNTMLIVQLMRFYKIKTLK